MKRRRGPSPRLSPQDILSMSREPARCVLSSESRCRFKNVAIFILEFILRLIQKGPEEHMRMNEEQMMVKEIAAALAGGISLLVKDRLNESMDGAMTEMGVFDGDEVPLPGDLADPRMAGELIAEELLARPELYAALSAIGSKFVRRLKTGE